MTSTEHINKCNYLWQIFTCKPKNLIGLGLFLLVFYFLTGKTSVKYRDVTFDYLLFTQRWLPTACIQYVERDGSFSRRCTLPTQFKMWAIHGLWPSKNHHMGPFFCNTSLPFDLNAIQPIVQDLIMYWPNIEGERDFTSLWRHEWEKHGTCAAQLPSLNTEFKYFNTTLGFYKTYNIENVLRKHNIEPSMSSGYHVSDLLNIFLKEFGKTPQVHCIFETHTHQPYLFEIRMCFSQNLELIDCEGVSNRFSEVSNLTNCPRDRVIIYPNTSVPPNLSKRYLENAEKNLRLQFYDLLQLIKLAQWILL